MNTHIAKRFLSKLNETDYPHWKTGLLQCCQLYRENTPAILTEIYNTLQDEQVPYFFQLLADLVDTPDVGLSTDQRHDWLRQYIAYECDHGIYYTEQLPHLYVYITTLQKKDLVIATLHEAYDAILCDLQSNPTDNFFKKRMSRLLRHIASAIIAIPAQPDLQALQQKVENDSGYLLNAPIFKEFFKPVLTFFDLAYYQMKNRFPYG